jgi:hypothetical protein
MTCHPRRCLLPACRARPSTSRRTAAPYRPCARRPASTCWRRRSLCARTWLCCCLRRELLVELVIFDGRPRCLASRHGLSLLSMPTRPAQEFARPSPRGEAGMAYCASCLDQDPAGHPQRTSLRRAVSAARSVRCSCTTSTPKRVVHHQKGRPARTSRQPGAISREDDPASQRRAPAQPPRHAASYSYPVRSERGTEMLDRSRSGSAPSIFPVPGRSRFAS